MTTATGNQAGVDFVSVAVAAELVNQGGGSLYDLAAQRTEQLELSGDPTGPGGEAVVTVLGWVVLVAGVAGLAVLAARTATTGQRCSAPPLAVAAVLGILVLPHANPHDLAWVPLAFALCWAHPNWPTRPRWQRQVLLGTAVLWAPATWVALATAPRRGNVAPVVLLVVFGAVAGRTPAAPPAPGAAGPARHPGEVGVTLR